jgi:hypothetical protein
MAGRPSKGPGRPKGSVNKLTIPLREMVLGALVELGGQAYLVKVGRSENPSSFMSLVGKCLPQAHTVSGEESSPLITRVEVVLVGKDSEK